MRQDAGNEARMMLVAAVDEERQASCLVVLVYCELWDPVNEDGVEST